MKLSYLNLIKSSKYQMSLFGDLFTEASKKEEAKKHPVADKTIPKHPIEPKIHVDKPAVKPSTKLTVKPTKPDYPPKGATHQQIIAMGWGPIKHPRGGKRGYSKLVGGYTHYYYPDERKGAATYRKEATKAAAKAEKEFVGPSKPPDKIEQPRKHTISSSQYIGIESKDKLTEVIGEALGKHRSAVMKHLNIKHVSDNKAHKEKIITRDAQATLYVPPTTTWEIEFDYDPEIPGHTPIGHVEEGAITTWGKGDITPTDFKRAQSGECDVCKTNRKRNKVFVVRRDADNEHILVGGECAKKFHGHDISGKFSQFDAWVKALAGVAAELAEANYDPMSEGMGGGGKLKYAEIDHILAIASYVTADAGYIKGNDYSGMPGENMPTQVMVRGYLSNGVSSKELKEFKKHQDWVKQNLPGLKKWVRSQQKEEERKGVAGFMTSIDYILNEKNNLANIKTDIGRLAWVSYGYKKHLGEIEEQERKKKTGQDPKPYRTDNAKVHDLPGEWTITDRYDGENDWGTYYQLTCMREDTGERIRFNVTGKMFDTIAERGTDSGGVWQDPALEEGAKLQLRGKVKKIVEPGTFRGRAHPGLTRMTHMSFKKGSGVKAKEKAEKARITKKRKEVKAKYAAMAKRADFWRKDIDHIKKETDSVDTARSKISETVRAKWESSLSSALKKEGAAVLDFFNTERYYRDAYSDPDVMQLATVVRSGKIPPSDSMTNPWAFPESEQVDSIVEKFPLAKYHVGDLRVRNPEWEYDPKYRSKTPVSVLYRDLKNPVGKKSLTYNDLVKSGTLSAALMGFDIMGDLVKAHQLTLFGNLFEGQIHNVENKAKGTTHSHDKDAKTIEKKQLSTGQGKGVGKGGPYLGPRGGKWADPQHTIPWKEDKPAKNKEKSKGHIRFRGDYEIYEQNNNVYIAPKNNPLDVDGYRQGGRWESSRTHWDRYNPEDKKPSGKKYKYGVPFRPVSTATVPKGYVGTEKHEKYPHGLVIYDRPLTDKEIKSYELTQMKPLKEIASEVYKETALGEYPKEILDHDKPSEIVRESMIMEHENKESKSPKQRVLDNDSVLSHKDFVTRSHDRTYINLKRDKSYAGDRSLKVYWDNKLDKLIVEMGKGTTSNKIEESLESIGFDSYGIPLDDPNAHKPYFESGRKWLQAKEDAIRLAKDNNITSGDVKKKEITTKKTPKIAVKPEKKQPSELSTSGQTVGGLPFPVSEGDIPHRHAQEAHRHTSWTPEKRGEQEQQDYVATMRRVWEKYGPMAKTPEDRAELLEDLKRYQRGWIQKNMARLAARSRTASTMITGGSGFNVRQNQKRMAHADKRTDELLEWSGKALKAIERKIKARNIEAAGGPLEILKKDITELEEYQKHMKDSNKIFRSKKLTNEQKIEQLKEIGMKEVLIDKLLNPSFGKQGYQSYQLTNNNATIKRKKERLSELQAKESAPETKPVKGKGWSMEEHKDDDRLRLYFDSKPTQEQRTALKQNGFRWSPKSGAWQRKITNAARYKAKYVLDNYFS